MLFNEFLRANIILNMICEDVDLDNESLIINKVLLDEDESPIDIINKIDSKNKDIKEESDETIEDIFSTLDVDSLIDRLELEEDEEENNAERLNLKLDNSSSDVKLKLNLSNDDNDEEIDDVINLKLNKKSNNDLLVNIKEPKDDLSVKINNKDNSDISVKIKDTEDIKVNINKKESLDDSDIDTNNDEMKVTIKNKESSKGDFNLKLRDVSGSNKSIDSGDINIKLKNVSKEPEDKISLFINKRDELISTNNPNLQLSTCLKIIINLKKSLERLVNYIPDENTLAQTKYLVGDLLDNLMDNSNIILHDPERMKKIIYKIFDMLLSINNYIENKYIEIEDRLDDTTKKQEDKDIDKSIRDTEVIKAFKDVAKLLGNDVEKEANDFLKSDSYKENKDNKDNKDIKPVPNINKKRI